MIVSFFIIKLVYNIKIGGENMIDIKERVVLGNLPQTIHIKGNDEDNPVLLFVHGGPGISNRHTVMQTNDDLLDVFTIVAWDQRGTLVLILKPRLKI